MENKKILIVDDEEDVLNVLERRLSVAGYSVFRTTNGKDAIITAKEKQPDLIILDIIMPGMDGADVANVLKNDPLTKNIPILFLTCLITPDEERTGNLISGSYFIAKPYNPEELLREIRKHL